MESEDETQPLSWVMLGGIALTVWHGAYTKADDATPGQEKVRAGAPQTLIKPSSGAPQSATPRAVCTFASIGLYWTPDGGADDKPCRVRYRAIGEPAWREALPLWFDKRIGEYRGSIVQLPSGTTYDVRLELAGGGPSTELKAATWSETFPVARTVPVDDMTGKTLTVDQSGTAAGYVLYTHRAGAATATIDAADQVDHCVEVKASYVIIRGLTLRSPKIHGIVLAKDAHDVVIEGCDISGWGRIDKDGWGIDYDSAIYSKYQPLTRVVIQRNRMHDPRSNSNSWQEFREGGERYHPKGPQAICFFESAGNHVFRYNEFTTDEKHYCNDIFGGGANRSLRGFPGADSDVYGNHIEGCWDDGLELEGGGCNVRVWGNYIDRTMVKIAIAGIVGRADLHLPQRRRRQPFRPHKLERRAVSEDGRCAADRRRPGVRLPQHDPPAAGPPEARGTIGCAEGLNQSGGPELLSVVSRNNILHVRHKDGHSIRQWSKEPDYDYDLISGKVVSAGKQESHGVVGVPVYATPPPGGRFLARSRQSRF